MAPPSTARRLGGVIRLVHPFPSLLDGVATTAIGLLAGGGAPVALGLGLSMVGLQASIGALNDLLDAPTDADRKPGKPIPAGWVGLPMARAVVVVAAGFGLGLASLAGTGTLVLAGLVLVIGYGYDLFAKGTSWSWLPFALGTALLPVYAWFGAVGKLPAPFAILLPTALAAGAALALANARADLDRDRAAGVSSVASRLGSRRAWSANAILMAGVIAAALGSLVVADAAPVADVGAIAASLVIGVGVLWAARSDASEARRERAWEIEAIGVVTLAVAWLAGIGDLR